MLGARMEQEGSRALTSEARLCYVCSGNVERLVECWAKPRQASSPMALQVPLLCRSLGEASGGYVQGHQSESSGYPGWGQGVREERWALKV